MLPFYYKDIYLFYTYIVSNISYLQETKNNERDVLRDGKAVSFTLQMSHKTMYRR